MITRFGDAGPSLSWGRRLMASNLACTSGAKKISESRNKARGPSGSRGSRFDSQDPSRPGSRCWVSVVFAGDVDYSLTPRHRRRRQPEPVSSHSARAPLFSLVLKPYGGGRQLTEPTLVTPVRMATSLPSEQNMSRPPKLVVPRKSMTPYR